MGAVKKEEGSEGFFSGLGVGVFVSVVVVVFICTVDSCKTRIEDLESDVYTLEQQASAQDYTDRARSSGTTTTTTTTTTYIPCSVLLDYVKAKQKENSADWVAVSVVSLSHVGVYGDCK